MSTNNNLHIYVGAENKDLEKLDNGIYKLNNPTGSFTVSIKEYEDELKKLDKASPDYEKKLENLKASYSDVVWIYQLSGSKLPENPTVNSFNEAIGNAIKWTPRIDELEVGGGFVYIQPYRKEQIPSVGLDRGAIFFSEGNPKILGAMWFEDEKGEKPIGIDRIIGFNSTVYLFVYTQGLYGQMLDIQFKDDDSIFSENEENNSDDDLGIYPNSPFRDGYRMEYDIPEKIQRDSKVIRQVNAINININAISDNAIRGELLVEDGNKTDQKIQKDTFVQGVYFPVYIDPFWSKEAYLETIEGEEIEVFPTISNKNIEKAEILKNATLKVSIKAKPINEHIERGNKPVLVGEAEANYAFYHHCRYDTIKLSKKGQKPIITFDLTNTIYQKNNPILIDIVAGEKEQYYLDFNFQTEECLKNHNKDKLYVVSTPHEYGIEVSSKDREDNKINENNQLLYKRDKTINTSVLGISSNNKGQIQKQKGIIIIHKNQLEFDTFYNYDIPNNNEASPLTIFNRALKYFWLPSLEDNTNLIGLKAFSCAREKNLNIRIYPDIKWTLKFGFNITAENIESLNRRGKKSPLGIFKVLENDKETINKNISKGDRSFFRENKSLRNTKRDIINSTREQLLLPKKLRKEKDGKQKKNKGSIRNLIEVLKEIKISLIEEHYDGKQENELNEEFIKLFYNQYQSQLEILLQAIEIIEGKKDPSEEKIKKIIDDKDGNEGKSLEKLRKKLNRVPTEYEILYPQIAFAASWFYNDIDSTQYPSLLGKKGMDVEINLKAIPLIGLSVKWDLLELLCRKHPIAYAILKALDTSIYILLDDESAVTCEFSVRGQIDAEINWQYNMLAGFKDLTTKGKEAIQIDIHLNIKMQKTIKLWSVEAYKKLELGVGGAIGLGVQTNFGADSKGLYIQKNILFEGIKLMFKAEVNIGLTKTKGEKKQNILDTGEKIDGEITMLSQTLSTDKLYFNRK